MNSISVLYPLPQTGPLYYNKDKDGEYGSISDLPALTVTRNGTECIFINDNIKNGDVYKVGVNGDVYKVWKVGNSSRCVSCKWSIYSPRCEARRE